MGITSFQPASDPVPMPFHQIPTSKQYIVGKSSLIAVDVVAVCEQSE